MKNKIIKGAAASVLAIGGLVGSSVPAQAAAGPDCWPGGCSGYYTSSDNHGRGGWSADPNKTYDMPSQIWWYDDHVEWQGVVKDVYADGKAARAVAVIDLHDGSNATQYMINASNGAGTSSTGHYSKYGTVNDNSTVTIWMCNGLVNVYTADNCSVAHGPFHRY